MIKKTLLKPYLKQSIEKMPIGFSGLGLGVAGLGNAWSALLNNPTTLKLNQLDPDYWNITKTNNLAISAIAIQAITIFITLLCFILILVRMIWHHKVFWKEIKDPLISSFLPTEAMCLSSIANFIGVASTFGYSRTAYVLNVGTIISCILMLISIVFHLFLFFCFLWFVIKNHNFKEDLAYASWFVPTSGLCLSCSFYPDMGNLIPNEFFQALWYLAAISFFALFPLILYKHMFFWKKIDANHLATAAIFLASPNLLLNGMDNLFTNYSSNSYYPPYYLSSNGQPYYLFVIGLIVMCFCIFGTIIFYVLLFKIIKVKFNPTYASLTFPASISALATLKFSQSLIGTYVVKSPDGSLIATSVPIINENGLNDNTTIGFLYTIHKMGMFFGFVFLVVGTLIISWILVKFISLLIRNFKITKIKNLELFAK